MTMICWHLHFILSSKDPNCCGVFEGDLIAHVRLATFLPLNSRFLQGYCALSCQPIAFVQHNNENIKLFVRGT